MKVLFVTKDIRPVLIAREIAKELARREIEIAVVCEGPSVDRWQNAGFQEAIVAKGVDLKDVVNSEALLSEIRPNVVVAGLSSPIRTEADFAAAAKKAGYPLVFIDDNWGSINRCRETADLVLTIDKIGETLVRKDRRYSAFGEYIVVVVIGDTAGRSEIPVETIEAFRQAKGDAEFVFLLSTPKRREGDEVVSAALNSLAKSIGSGRKIAVIPRFHPGAATSEKEVWQHLVNVFEGLYPGSVRPVDGHDTDHLAALADGVFALTGSSIRAAAYAGKMPICVWSPALSEVLQFESGHPHHPLVMVEAALELSGAEDIVERMITEGADIYRAQRELLVPEPFDPKRAAAAIIDCHLRRGMLY